MDADQRAGIDPAEERAHAKAVEQNQADKANRESDKPAAKNSSIICRCRTLVEGKLPELSHRPRKACACKKEVVKLGEREVEVDKCRCLEGCTCLCCRLHADGERVRKLEGK